MLSETLRRATAMRLGWALAIVALPAWAQEPPASEQTADPAAKGEDSGLSARVTTGYPERALRNGLTGTVGLTVTVTPEGRATDCVVTQSSGHAELDFAACKELQEKARFEPALDADGKPISAQFSTKITFKIK